MSGALKLEFASFATPAKGVLVLFCEEGLKFGAAARRAIEPTGDLVTRAAAADRFKGKNGSALDIVAPPGLDAVAPGRGRGRQGARSQGAGFRQARRHRHGQDSGGGERGDHRRRPAGRRHQAGSDRRHRARRAAARLCLRSLQDQAQGGRGEGGADQGHDRGRRRRRGGEGVRARAARWQTAWRSRAISSTSRPTCSTRRNSPAAPAI